MKNKFRGGRMLKLGVTSPYLHKYVVSEPLIILLMPVHIAVQTSYPYGRGFLKTVTTGQRWRMCE
jgi:hypothetical protein